MICYKKIFFLIAISLLFVKGIGLVEFSYTRLLSVKQREVGRKRIPYRKNEFLESLRNFIDKNIQGMGDKQFYKPKKKPKYKFVRHKKKTIDLIKKNRIICSENNPSFGLYFLPFNKRVEINGGNISEPIQNLDLESNLSNYSAFQIVISAYEKIRDIKVSNSSGKINFYIGEYIDIRKSLFSRDVVTIQDPLIPMVSDDKLNFKTYRPSFAIESNKSVPIWVEVRTEEGIGTFSEIIVEAKNETGKITKYNVPLKIRQKKNKQSVKSIYPFFSYNHKNTLRYYNNDILVKKNYSRNMEFICSYGLYPVSLYPKMNDVKRDGFISQWVKLKQKGASVFILRYINEQTFFLLKDSLPYREEFIASLKKQENFLSEINILSNSYIYMFDELPEYFNERLNFTTSLLKENGIKSKLISTALNPSNLNLLDFHCPLLNKENKKFNHEKWAYICCVSPKEENLLLESSLNAIQKLHEKLIKNNISHFLYYALNNWKGNIYVDRKNYKPYWKLYQSEYEEISKGNKWPGISWIPYSATRCKLYGGDGYLIYPGNNGEFWPSARLINFCINFSTIK